MDLYHGTSEAVAIELTSNPQLVSVEKGGGELGRGFYLGDHVALAAAWARGRYRGKIGVIAVSIDASEYVKLTIKVLNWQQVLAHWNELRAHGKTRTFLFGWDIVHGPLATLQHATQHKFESFSAGEVLRSSAWRKL